VRLCALSLARMPHCWAGGAIVGDAGVFSQPADACVLVFPHWPPYALERVGETLHAQNTALAGRRSK
jgi:hypothetical protein